MALNMGGTLSKIGTGITKNMTTSKYRTGVVNDFSIVTKAVFYVLEKNRSGKYKVEDCLPVQINPSSYSRETQANPHQLKGLLSSLTYPISETYGSSDYSSEMTIELKYSVFDEYNICTMDGMAANTAAITDISLENEKVTSLPKLRNLCGSGKLVIFKWGQTQLLGCISSVRCDYTSFSRWGEPLECTASVSFRIEPENGEAYKAINSTISIIQGKIKTYETASNLANRAALGMSQALR